MQNQSNLLVNLIILKKAEDYINVNSERFNATEKENFLSEVKNYLFEEDAAIADEVFDFLVSEKLVHNKPRHETFINYLIKKYNSKKHPNVLDVGAGRLCNLSSALGAKGFKTTAIDPKIRLNSNEIKARKIKNIIKQPFYCDEYSDGSGTNVNQFDLLVGLEPCDATEHIIRQGLKYEKPFEISLCYQAHDALNGQKFETPEDWYEYLQQISTEIKISKNKSSFVASRN